MTKAQPHPDWVTHRLPTEEDADHAAEVHVPASNSDLNLNPSYACHRNVYYGNISPGQPWWSRRASANSTPPAIPLALAPTGKAPALAPAREVKQIAAMTGSEANNAVLFALCSDSAIFALRLSGKEPDGKWTQLPPIPQPESNQ